MHVQHGKTLTKTPMISYQAWLDHLGVIYPVTGVLHVGVGIAHSVECYKKWRVPSVVYVEADKYRLASISATIKGIDGWVAHGALLAGKSEPGVFYRASNPNESGLLVPETLTPLWQNLKTVERQRRQATTIKALFETHAEEMAAHVVNRVHIDCLPALPILQGAEDLLDSWDVVIARAILDETLMDGQWQAGKNALDAFMLEHGFINAAVEPERHPAIGQVLYVRNWKNELLTELGSQKDQRQQQADQLQTQINRLTEERDRQQQATAQFQAELASSRHQQDEQHKQIEEQQEQITAVAAQRDEQTKLTEQHAAKTSELTKAQGEQQKLAEQQNQEMERLRSEQEKRIDKLAAELKDMEQTVENAKKRLLLRDGDLEHLRGKFRELKELHDAKQELLQQLRAKLLSASKYVGQLKKSPKKQDNKKRGKGDDKKDDFFGGGSDVG